MRHLLLAMLIGLTASASTGCGIPKSKYNATLDELKKCQSDSATCTADRDANKKKADDLSVQLEDVNKQLVAEKDVRVKIEGDLNALQENLKATTDELDQLRKARAEAEKRLAAFRELTAKFKKMIDSGKIQVQFRRGQMLVKLPAGILFASGKADLSKEGQAALVEVAGILKDVGTDRRWDVAGHTDNVGLPRGSKYKDNWELSTARAVTVTKYLIEAGLTPAQLSATGFGEFDPVGDNKTDEGRQENRRIEIILVPNIEELPSLPEDSAGTN